MKAITKWKKGSFTVEAAFLVPAAVMITVLLIFCIFYVHNQVWYGTAALEAALAGNGRTEGSGKSAEETAKSCAVKRAEEQVMPGETPSVEARDSGTGIYVSFRGNIFPLFAGWSFYCLAEAEVERVRPVKFLRIMWMMDALGQAAEFSGL